MNWYNMSPDDVEKNTNSRMKTGLTTDESKKRLAEDGYNQLKEAKKPSAILVFLNQFKDFMVLVLLAAILLSGLLGEYLDAIAILLIVIMNGILGFVQERKAEKSLSALLALSAPTASVLRDGEWVTLPAREITAGDIIKVSSGDRVGADIRFTGTKGLAIEESALTGESVPVQKQSERISGNDLPLGDQSNMGFMGTMVTQGSGEGIVIATGMKTEMGKIAHLIQSAESMVTPLQHKLEQLGKILIALSIALTVLVVGIGVYQGHSIYDMILSGVSLAVAAIPEGLPAIVTIALALGVQKMIRRKAIVRKLPSVETLGSTTVICSDKTGTLTQNKMTVTHLWVEGKDWQVTEGNGGMAGRFLKGGKPVDVENEKTLVQLLSYAVLCNNAEATLEEDENDDILLKGDPTESALVVSGLKAGLTRKQLLKLYERLDEFPFDSSRKMMSVVVKNNKGERFVITKGAPDVLLEKCDAIIWNGKPQRMQRWYSEKVRKALSTLGSQALRTIAIAYKPLKGSYETADQAEKNLTFVGLQGMIDPPRPEVYESIQQCKQAGIKTVMITGDHVVTATAIAKQLDILPPDGKVLEGRALSAMTDRELENEVDQIYVYARVSPEHKLKIVKALQKKDHIVAMTGDGVNDAPAIKSANIGIAMGHTGTDVAKEASSLVLSDDNFATIRSAIEEGRNIYENIRKFIRYLLASNVGEILVMLFAMLIGLPLPLLPIQILWVNLVTDGLPAMALGVDQAEENVMTRGPRMVNEGVFSRGLGWKIISRGFLIGVMTLFAFWLSLQQSPDQLVKAQTVAFSTLVMAQLIHVFDCRSERSVFHRHLLENRYLVGAVLSSVILLLIVIYTPMLQPVFHTVPLTIRDWLLILAMASVPTVCPPGFHFFKKKGTSEPHRPHKTAI
ncbi:Ca2+-transporting ATPase [Scopulibacillus darangshiensis]|uniref:Ca2+-transporting ATPase n=1 Tax=Scopulibacillus darangshiensis TaxID=442528 RepID=A0A4R2NM70_9BACL|nr:cation-translocating P-type ATPase [Scopulibacillus darangshiensis]TCP22697.1 Ca2+-transporting ATPase [Scopulibacillus darangshiensis]